MNNVVTMQRLKKGKLTLAIIFFPITIILLLIDGLMQYIVVASDSPLTVSFMNSHGFKRMNFFEIMYNQIKTTAYNAFYDWIITTEDKACNYPNHYIANKQPTP